MPCSGNPVLFNNADGEVQAGMAKVADLISERRRMNAAALASQTENIQADEPPASSSAMLMSQSEEYIAMWSVPCGSLQDAADGSRTPLTAACPWHLLDGPAVHPELPEELLWKP